MEIFRVKNKIESELVVICKLRICVCFSDIAGHYLAWPQKTHKSMRLPFVEKKKN